MKRLSIQSLERRQLMAADVELVDSTLHIQGTAGNDIAEVYTADDSVVVKLQTRDSDNNVIDSSEQSFDADVVDGIIFEAFAGDDLFVNDTHLSSIMRAGGGSDTLMGGTGNDILVAGDGPDVVLGGGGNDILLGGNGENIILETQLPETQDDVAETESPDAVDEAIEDSADIDTSESDTGLPSDDAAMENAIADVDELGDPVVSIEDSEVIDDGQPVDEPVETVVDLLDDLDSDPVHCDAHVSVDADIYIEADLDLEVLPVEEIDSMENGESAETVDLIETDPLAISPAPDALPLEDMPLEDLEEPTEGESIVDEPVSEETTAEDPQVEQTSVDDDPSAEQLPEIPAATDSLPEATDAVPDSDDLNAANGDSEIETDDAEELAGTTQEESISNSDALITESDNDVIFGGDGDDWLFGEDGNDTVFGGDSPLADALLEQLLDQRLA